MQATALPATRNGQVIGFELSQIDPSSIFDKAGLIDKDIVKKINGIAVNSAPQAIKLLKSLKSEKNIILEYERNGQDAKIEINVAH
jgi:type II secretion system protein C